MDATPYLILLALLLVKEGGLPIPVPGDLLVLGAGVAAAGQGVGALPILAGILVAGFLGGAVQFLLVRDALRGPMLALLAKLGVSEARLDILVKRVRSGGSRTVAVARATPGLRIAAIAASGLAALPFPVFVRGLVAGNTIFVGGHFALGFAVGMPALAIVTNATVPIVLLVAGAALALLGAVGWRWIRRRQRAEREPPSMSAVDIGAGSWIDAACPACLGLALMGGSERRSP
jgi:membrane-associated protein